MSSAARKPNIRIPEFLGSWWSILTGHAPMLSIEVTRECPLHCPGCYAYAPEHLGNGLNLRQLSDFRGDDLVNGVLDLVRRHRPLHVSLVGGEPMVRKRELGRILPALGAMSVHTLLVTSGIVPVPTEWMHIPRLRVALSVDGLPEHHDERRKPATYERILANIAGCSVNVHWTLTRPMLARPDYIEEYVRFWSERPETNRIWVSFYSPKLGEHSDEMLSPAERRAAAGELVRVRQRYPRLLMDQGYAKALLEPPRSPEECLFSRMSTNYSADLKTRVEPCILGGSPDCSQCGCAASAGLHYVKNVKIAGRLRIGHLVQGSIRIGAWANRWRKQGVKPSRWYQPQPDGREPELVQITSD